MEIFWPALLIVCLGLFWVMTLIGLPGNWLMLFSVIGYAYFYNLHPRAMMGWVAVVAIASLILLAEIVELVAGAAGMAKGGSRRGAILAVIGSLVGSFMGASFGSVVPILGTVIGILLGASVGAMVGAILGESTLGKSSEQQWEIGKAAFWGRLWGSIGKIVVGAIVVGIATASVIFK